MRRIEDFVSTCSECNDQNVLCVLTLTRADVCLPCMREAGLTVHCPQCEEEHLYEMGGKEFCEKCYADDAPSGTGATLVSVTLSDELKEGLEWVLYRYLENKFQYPICIALWAYLQSLDRGRDIVREMHTVMNLVSEFQSKCWRLSGQGKGKFPVLWWEVNDIESRIEFVRMLLGQRNHYKPTGAREQRQKKKKKNYSQAE